MPWLYAEIHQDKIIRLILLIVLESMHRHITYTKDLDSLANTDQQAALDTNTNLSGTPRSDNNRTSKH